MANRSAIRITKLAHLKGHRGAIYHFSAKDQELFSVGSDGHIVRWNPMRGPDGQSIVHADECWYCSYLDQTEAVLYAGSRTGRVIGLDLTVGKVVYDAQRHAGAVYFITMAYGQLFSGGQDGSLVTAGMGQKLSAQSLRSVLVGEKGLLIGDSGGQLITWNREVQGVIHAHERAVFGLAWMDGRIASTGMDGRIRVWNELNDPVLSVQAHERQGKSLSFNGTYLLSGSMDSTIRIWDPDLRLHRQIDRHKDDGHVSSVNHVCWLNGDSFASCSDDGTIIVWQMAGNT